MATIWKRFKNIGLLFIAASLVTLLSLHKKVFNLTSQQRVFLKERIVNRCQQTSQMEREEIAIEANLISLSEWVKETLIASIRISKNLENCYLRGVTEVLPWLYRYCKLLQVTVFVPLFKNLQLFTEAKSFSANCVGKVHPKLHWQNIFAIFYASFSH